MTTPIQGIPPDPAALRQAIADPAALRQAIAEHDLREAEAAAQAQSPEDKAAACERIRTRLAAANLGPVLEGIDIEGETE